MPNKYAQTEFNRLIFDEVFCKTKNNVTFLWQRVAMLQLNNKLYTHPIVKEDTAETWQLISEAVFFCFTDNMTRIQTCVNNNFFTVIGWTILVVAIWTNLCPREAIALVSPACTYNTIGSVTTNTLFFINSLGINHPDPIIRVFSFVTITYSHTLCK